MKTRRRNKDVKDTFKDVTTILSSKRKRTYTMILIALIVYAFPIISLLLWSNNVTGLTLFASGLITIIVACVLISMLGLKISIILSGQIHELEELQIEINSKDGAKYFEKNLVTYDRIIRLGHS